MDRDALLIVSIIVIIVWAAVGNGRGRWHQLSRSPGMLGHRPQAGGAAPGHPSSAARHVRRRTQPGLQLLTVWSRDSTRLVIGKPLRASAPSQR